MLGETIHPQFKLITSIKYNVEYILFYLTFKSFSLRVHFHLWKLLIVSPKRINTMKEQNIGTVIIKKSLLFFKNGEITSKLHWVVDLMENCPIFYSVQCYHASWKYFKVYDFLLLLMILFKCLQDDFKMGTSAFKFLGHSSNIHISTHILPAILKICLQFPSKSQVIC